MKDIKTLNLAGKKVLLRADLNVPAHEGTVTDTTRIDRVKETISNLRDQNAKIIVLSHFGRPKGEAKPEYSLEFLVPALEKSWGCPVAFAKNCIGPTAEKAVSKLENSNVLLLENVRFYAGEEKNDPEFTKALSKLGDIYVNDAFSAAHRAHASTEGLAHYLPAAPGLLMSKELDALNNALENPAKPVTAIVGGAKISTKLSVLNNIVQKVDYLILGGAMANTFLLAEGAEIGNSMAEKNMLDEARAISALAKKTGCQIVLPKDVVAAEKFEANAPHEAQDAMAIKDGFMAVDMAEQSLKAYRDIIEQSRTVLWNGPLGVFELKPFDNGTNNIAQFVAMRTKENGLTSVAGGGDTVAALINAGTEEDFTYVSSAGGAFLEWLEGKELPGIKALLQSKEAA